MSTNRRSLILGATLGMVAPSLVRAQSLIDVPGDPLTKHGLHAASTWAVEHFNEMPACRLVFASGHAHRWMTYNTLFRTDKATKQRIDHAVAIETAVTDARGRRFIHSTPIDAVGLEKLSKDRVASGYKPLMPEFW